MSDGERVARPAPSAFVLVAANLLPLYGVMVLGWEVFAVVLLFWFENVIIGVFNVARLLMVKAEDVATWIGKVAAAVFFSFHYGAFTAIHGLFVVMLFGREYVPMNGVMSWGWVGGALAASGAMWAALAFAVSHGFSFVWNYVGHGEYRRTTVQQLMMQPYSRVIVLHLAILGGGFLVLTFNVPLVGLALLVVLKIGLDVRAHLREHRQVRVEPA